MVSCIFTSTGDLDAQFPAVAARDLGLDTCRCCVPARSTCRARSSASSACCSTTTRATHRAARLPRRGQSLREGPAKRHNRRFDADFLRGKLARIPHYEAGATASRRPGGRRRETSLRLASNESPLRARRGGRRGGPRAAADVNRYPDPGARALRGGARGALRLSPAPDRGRQRLVRDPARSGRGAAGAGSEVVYAWPSFSMYPHLAAITGAEAVTVPLADGEVHDLEAMQARDQRRTRLAGRLQPEQPDGTHVPSCGDRGLPREGPPRACS